MQTDRDRAHWVRGKWWLAVIVLVIGYGMLTKEKPQRYLDESAVMEQVAGLLDSPVPYERTEGWSWAPYVTRVVLPRADLDPEKTRQLAILLKKLPRLGSVHYHYVSEQEGCVAQLERDLAGHATVYEDLGGSTLEKEKRQKRTYVAGVHRPGILLAGRQGANRPLPRFEQRLKSGRFRWATNLPVDLLELHALAVQTWSATSEWLHLSEEDQPGPDSPLPVFLCASPEELQAIEERFGQRGSSFRERSHSGGYYPGVPLIAVVTRPGDAATSVVHEVVHAVMERVVPGCPYLLNEGAAMLLTERVLGGRPEYAAWAAGWERDRSEICAALEVESLSLEELFSLSFLEFCDTRDSRNYLLGLELVRVLDREDAIRYPRAFQRLLRALAGRPRADAFRVFSGVYPVAEVEALWKEQLRQAARRTEPH